MRLRRIRIRHRRTSPAWLARLWRGRQKIQGVAKVTPLLLGIACIRKITLYVIRGLLTKKNYVGITNNLERRLNEHRSGNSKGGQIIGDFELIHTETFYNYAEARKREIYLKSGQGRQWIADNLTRPAKGG